jgi:hypothetical protein
MDEFLNELYGTSETIAGGDDLEKNAAAEFLVKLAEEEGVNLDDLSDEEVGGLLSEIEGDMAKQAGAEDPEGEGDAGDGEAEAQEKLAEADFLGRAMAHAYVNELAEIEKQAGVKETAGKAVGYIGKKLEQLGGAAAKRSKRISGHIGKKGQEAYKAQVMKRLQQARGSGMKGRTAKRMREAARKEGVAAGTKAMSRRQKLIGGALAGTGAAGLGAAGYGAKEALSHDQAFEAAARERAYEILAEAGHDVEKQAQADINVAALQLLENAGYEVNWGEE